MAKTRLAVIVVVVLLALLAVTLTMLMVPGLSWAAVYEWIEPKGGPPRGCLMAPR